MFTNGEHAGIYVQLSSAIDWIPGIDVIEAVSIRESLSWIDSPVIPELELFLMEMELGSLHELNEILLYRLSPFNTDG